MLQLRPSGPQWMWEDDASEMHRGNAENLAGAHHRVGEAARVSRPRRAGEDGRIHAAGKRRVLKWFTDDTFLHLHNIFLAISFINKPNPAANPCKSKDFYIIQVHVDLKLLIQIPLSPFILSLSEGFWASTCSGPAPRCFK